MSHPIYWIQSFKILAPYTLSIQFNDKTEQTVNFQPILTGALYGPLQDLKLFNQVQLDSEIHTLVWPNGADFDPATLHDWPQHAEVWATRAKQWQQSTKPEETTPQLARTLRQKRRSALGLDAQSSKRKRVR